LGGKAGLLADGCDAEKQQPWYRLEKVGNKERLSVKEVKGDEVARTNPEGVILRKGRKMGEGRFLPNRKQRKSKSIKATGRSMFWRSVWKKKRNYGGLCKTENRGGRKGASQKRLEVWPHTL